jgi:hypothetical protein
MNKKPKVPGSIVTCVNKEDGAVLKLGTTSRLIGPTLVDPFHLMIGAGCGDWGVCIYLSITDAAKLHVELGDVIAELAERG